MSPIGSNFPSLASALDIGAATIQAGAQQLNGEAQQIAEPNAPDATSALLNLNQSSLLAQAGAAVIRTSDRMLGTLLDAFA
jgi:hypothetical protein